MRKSLFYMEVSVVAELTVMPMERFLQETEESFSQETNHIKTIKRVPYVVVHAFVLFAMIDERKAGESDAT